MKKQIRNLIYSNYNQLRIHNQKYNINIDDNYIYKLVKRSMNQFLLHGIVGEFKRDIGLRIEPLLFDHTPLKRHELIRRINKHCSVTLSLIQISKERDSSFLILQLVLIAIDFLTKSQRLFQIYNKRDEKRKYEKRDGSSKIEEEKFTKINIEFFHRASNQIFSEVKIAMEKQLLGRLRESKLIKWINNITLQLDKIDTNSEEYTTNVEEFCKQAVENDEENSIDGKIILNFMKVSNSEIITLRKKIDFFASYNEHGKQFTPYSAIPGESKFKAD